MVEGLEISKNSLTGQVPTELGRLTKMTNHYYIQSNKLCDDVPTEVEALTAAGTITYYAISTANSIGTTCGWVDDSRFPELGSTGTTSIDYADQQLTGTIPTQVGVLTKVTTLMMNSNDLGGATN